MPKVVDLFAGCGGLSLGFQNAGFNIAGCVEIESVHAQTYLENFPEAVVINEPIENITAEELIKSVGEFEILIGGSPCQPYSRQSRQEEADPRRLLTWDYVRMVRDTSPHYFLMENVAELVQNRKFYSLVTDILNAFRSCGYQVSLRVLNASDYGIPQSRSRAFFMGSKRGKPRPRFPKPLDPITSTKVNIRDAIADLPEIEDFEELWQEESLDYSLLQAPSEYVSKLNRGINPQQITGMHRTDHTAEVRERFAKTPPGKIEPISRFKKLDWRGISPTLKAGTGSSKGRHTSARPIHPATPRCISVREYARIHSYPDWFKFAEVKHSALMQVGNSVCPLLSETLAREFLAVI